MKVGDLERAREILMNLENLERALKVVDAATFTVYHSVFEGSMCEEAVLTSLVRDHPVLLQNALRPMVECRIRQARHDLWELGIRFPEEE